MKGTDVFVKERISIVRILILALLTSVVSGLAALLFQLFAGQVDLEVILTAVFVGFDVGFIVSILFQIYVRGG